MSPPKRPPLITFNLTTEDISQLPSTVLVEYSRHGLSVTIKWHSYPSRSSATEAPSHFYVIRHPLMSLARVQSITGIHRSHLSPSKILSKPFGDIRIRSNSSANHQHPSKLWRTHRQSIRPPPNSKESFGEHLGCFKALANSSTNRPPIIWLRGTFRLISDPLPSSGELFHVLPIHVQARQTRWRTVNSRPSSGRTRRQLINTPPDPEGPLCGEHLTCFPALANSSAILQLPAGSRGTFWKTSGLLPSSSRAHRRAIDWPPDPEGPLCDELPTRFLALASFFESVGFTSKFWRTHQ